VVAGFATRLAALALAGDMIGAIIISGVMHGEGISLTLAPALLVATGLLVRYGPGRLSADGRPNAGRRRSTITSDQPSEPEVKRLEPVAPKICRLLEDAEADLLAFYGFPREHYSKLRSTNPLERVNREIGRRSDVVGIFPNDAAAIRLTGALLIEQNDEWLVSRRYLSAESIALVLSEPGQDDEHTPSQITKEATELHPA